MKWILSVVLISLTLSILGCQTTEKTVYVIPELEFPEYPNPFGHTCYDPKTDEVRMPLDYYQKIMEFKLKVYETRDVYNEAKDLYSKEKE